MEIGFLDTFLRFFFPDRCICCGKTIEMHHLYCPACEKNLPRIHPPLCLSCGMNQKDCTCTKHKNYFSQCIAPFYYENGIQNGIRRMKFQQKTYAAEGFGIEMAALAKQIYGNNAFDFIACIPLTKKGKRERGYNQSELIAKEIAKQLCIPFYPTILVKLFDNRPQHKLPAAERTGNVAGVFECTEPELVADKKILLIDDIKTTGATLNECAKMLLLNGAQEVTCLCSAIVREHKPAGKTSV